MGKKILRYDKKTNTVWVRWISSDELQKLLDAGFLVKVA